MAKGTVATYTENSNATPNNMLGRTGSEKDFLYCAEGRKGLSGTTTGLAWDSKRNGLALLSSGKAKNISGRFISAIIASRFPATEFLPSWNIALPQAGQGFQIFMRFYANPVGRPSPWLFVGEGGVTPEGSNVRIESSQWGSTHIDYVHLKRAAKAFQFKVECYETGTEKQTAHDNLLLRRFYVHYSGKSDKATPPRGINTFDPTSISVPYRSQLTVKRKELRNQICCPTSLAMVLEHHGISKDTLDVCAEVYDTRHDLYGLWPRTSHAAFQYGLHAWVHRFRTHDEVAKVLGTGQPIIASIRVGKGELRGARYPKSNGHIIVITGLTATGDYIVNDPASAGPGGAEISYFAEDMDKVWLDKGGVAILVKSE